MPIADRTKVHVDRGGVCVGGRVGWRVGGIPYLMPIADRTKVHVDRGGVCVGGGEGWGRDGGGEGYPISCPLLTEPRYMWIGKVCVCVCGGGGGGGVWEGGRGTLPHAHC